MISAILMTLSFALPALANECRAITDCSGGSCVARTVCSDQPRVSPRLQEERRQLENERRKLQRDRRALEDLQSKRQAEKTLSLNVSVTISPVQADGSVFLKVNTNKDVSSIQIDGYEQGGRDKGSYSFRRVPKVGTKTIYKVVVTDAFGSQQEKSVAVERVLAKINEDTIQKLEPLEIQGKTKKNTLAIIIGIANYKRIPIAQYADNDAKMFYDYAIRALGVEPKNIKLLVNEEADRIGIRRVLDSWLATRVNEKTEIYFFYSGHGYPSSEGGRLYFLPWDSDIDYLKDTAISQSLIFKSLQQANPKSVTLFIDSCYSGRSRTGETLLAGIRPLIIVENEQTIPKKFNMLTASGTSQISSSSEILQHGIFSFYLMKGLEGYADKDKNNRISLGELSNYVNANVNREAALLNRKQTSEFVGQLSKIIVNKIKQKK